MIIPILMAVTLNTAAVQLPDHSFFELCVVTVGKTPTTTYQGVCSDILPKVMNDVAEGYPGQPAEFIINGQNLNQI